MRIDALVERLRPLEGWRIRICGPDGEEREQACYAVEHLPVWQRVGDQGNVILHNGWFAPRTGAPGGLTLTAGEVLSVTQWEDRMLLTLTPRSRRMVYIFLIERIVEGGERWTKGGGVQFAER